MRHVTVDQQSTLPPTRSPDAAGGVLVGTLTAVYPPELAFQLVLRDEPAIIGREGPGVIAIAHPTVSRRHIGITSIGTAHQVSDLGSSHGSRLDGQPLSQPTHALDHNAVLQIGDVFLIYERGDPENDQVAVSQASVPGRSAAIRQLRVQIARAAPDPSPVLLLGETGTGKEWIARELHRLSGRRGPIVALNCAALSSQIVESQLFGHVKGAFTGATTDHPGLFRAANDGTLFLDELGELPLELQPKLLRALQDGQIMPVGGTRAMQVDVRVIAATNRDLRAAIDQGAFRLDLYSRLAMWEIALPPLRARRTDILSWLTRLGDAWSMARSQPSRRIVLMPDAVESLLIHPWPDNLRGIDRLVHVLRSNPAAGSIGGAAGGAAIGAAIAGAAIAASDLPAWITSAPAQSSPGMPVQSSSSGSMPAADEPRKRRPAPSREDFERAYAEHAGNVRALSRHFDRDRRQIYRWMDTYGLQRPTDED